MKFWGQFGEEQQQKEEGCRGEGVAKEGPWKRQVGACRLGSSQREGSQRAEEGGNFFFIFLPSD